MAGVDMFDFDVPNSLLGDGGAAGSWDAPGTDEEQKEFDSWFLEAHMTLLRPKMSTGARRRVARPATAGSAGRQPSRAPAVARQAAGEGPSSRPAEKAPSSSSRSLGRAAGGASAAPARAPRRAGRAVPPATASSPASAAGRPQPTGSSGQSLSRRPRSSRDVPREPAAPAGAPSLEAVLAAHNSRFKADVRYEPRRHSVRDVKAWERASGRTYATLSMAERAAANREISNSKQQA